MSIAETAPLNARLTTASLVRPSIPWLRVALWIIAVGLCLTPFLIVLVVSFGEKVEGASWRWGLSAANYQRVAVGALWPDSWTALHLQRLAWSFAYASVAAALAVATALPFAYFLTRRSRRAQTVWLVFLLASLALSEVFVVMGWDVLLSARSGVPMWMRETGATQWLKDVGWFPVLREWGLADPRNVRFKTSVLATTLTMSYLVWPYAVILLYPALSRLDPATMEAAATMGARPATVLRTVVLPAVRLPLLGAGLLLFVFLLGSYVTVTVFAEPARQTTAVAIYEAVRGSTLNAPFGAAQAMVLLAAAGAFLVLGRRLARP